MKKENGEYEEYEGRMIVTWRPREIRRRKTGKRWNEEV